MIKSSEAQQIIKSKTLGTISGRPARLCCNNSGASGRAFQTDGS